MYNYMFNGHRVDICIPILLVASFLLSFLVVYFYEITLGAGTFASRMFRDFRVLWHF